MKTVLFLKERIKFKGHVARLAALFRGHVARGWPGRQAGQARLAGRLVGRLTGIVAYMCTDRRANRQTGRRTDQPTVTDTDRHECRNA